MVAAALFLVNAAAAAQNPSIQFTAGEFKVSGWTPPSKPNDWSSVFVVYAGAGNVPALLGSYAVENGVLTFHPRYPITAGVAYRAIVKLPSGKTVEKIFAGPIRGVIASTQVDHVYPSAGILPSNQLRLYIYFSAPMSRGEAAQHVRILDQNGKALEGAHGIFLPGEELWDPGFRRLTLTFDPGRIKRGLTSNRTIGPPIAPGRRYTLVIDRDWPDARGAPMTEGYRKVFLGGPAERLPPDPKHWQVTAPKAGTSDALVVRFPNPMNFPLLQRMLQVQSAGGPVEGTVSIDRDETQWRFVPSHAWKAGNYRLTIDTRLEDLAGNHIGQAFDIDTFQRVTEHITTDSVNLPFAVR